MQKGIFKLLGFATLVIFLALPAQSQPNGKGKGNGKGGKNGSGQCDTLRSVNMKNYRGGNSTGETGNCRFDSLRTRHIGACDSTGRRLGNCDSTGRRFGNCDSTGRRFGNCDSTGRRFGNCDSTGRRFGNCDSTGRRFGNCDSTGRRHHGGKCRLQNNQNNDPKVKDKADNSSKNAFSVSQNAPNPTGNTATIKIVMPETQMLKVVVSDQNGNQLLVAYDGMMKAGESEIVLDLKGLNPGRYFYTATAGANSLTKQLILLK